MSKKNKKPQEPEFQVPKNLGMVAKEYYKKYDVLDTGFSSGSSGGGYTRGGNYGTYGSGTSSYTPSCEHWQDELELAEGVKIHASAYSDHPKKDWYYPAIGVYFASSWDDFAEGGDISFSTGWQGPKPKGKGKEVSTAELACIDWPDMNVPRDLDSTIEVLEYALNKAGDGEFVEIGCYGGHGRTGTAVAAMLVMLGEQNADKAIDWVQENYCNKAVESTIQEDWLWDLACKLYPDESPKIRKSVEESRKSKATKQSSWDNKTSVTQSDEFWLKQAADDVEHMTGVEGKNTTEAVKRAALDYWVDEDDLYEYLGNKWSKEVDDLTSEDEDKDKDTTEEIDKTLESYDVATLASEWLARESGGVEICGICDEEYSKCACFEDYGYI